MDTETTVTTEARVCPICLGLIRTEASVTDILEFADYPGVTYHAACVERIGVTRTRDILAQNYPVTDTDEDEADETPEEPGEEPTKGDTDDAAE